MGFVSAILWHREVETKLDPVVSMYDLDVRVMCPLTHHLIGVLQCPLTERTGRPLPVGLVTCTGSHLSQPRVGALAPQHTRPTRSRLVWHACVRRVEQRELSRKKPLHIFPSLAGSSLFSSKDPRFGLCTDVRCPLRAHLPTAAALLYL